MREYLQLGGGYSYAALRAGLVLRNATGKEVYFRSGDDEAAIRDTIDALSEIYNRVDALADMAFGDYFQWDNDHTPTH